ncbi:DNA-binding transcriptional ArsR family regulator [Lewinella aquimaris]|uniref:DNA-binding transcriptional ArsR family regulator n=1 Tax=Neolewinella aquimaris TaxID=1835722 RepID=A0A840EBL9_9BACT|nr:metalloregulator ArsR/SmtB family transcription factor [Neolewinella aquimaris]MBB4079398.1 DNA-binding transcriptional ArsR family regulator [Neolewinella aquimaris]
MGVTKTEAYTAPQLELAGLCKVLGHPARIAILEKLLATDCCICRDLTDEIDLAQPTVSRHLKELKDAGLIAGSTDGNTVKYCIDRERWLEISGLIDTFFARLPDCQLPGC